VTAAQLAGEDFLVGLNRQRADAAGQALAPVPGLSSTTAAGLARRFSGDQWRAVETGLARVTERMLTLLPATRQHRLTSTVTIDIDTTDVEVYGRKKRGVAYNYRGQRCGRPHVAYACVGNANLLRRGSDPDWPSAPDYWRLLVAADNRQLSAELLRATLAERTFRPIALTALELMVRAVDRDEGAREPLEALLLQAGDFSHPP
jgi:hypothetical protein